MEIQFLQRTLEKAKESLWLEQTLAGFRVLRNSVLVEEWINDIVFDLVQRHITSLNEFKENPETSQVGERRSGITITTFKFEARLANLEQSSMCFIFFASER